MGYTEKLANDFLAYKPPLTKKDDFDAFWQGHLAVSRAKPLNLTAEPVPSANRYINTYRVHYDGIDDTRIAAWFMTPTFLPQKNLPVMIHYNDPSPLIHNQWLLSGVCVFSPGTRGMSDDTPDRHTYNTCHYRYPLIYGVTDREDYFLKYVYLDAVRAIDAVCALPAVDASKVLLEGGSFGGGLTLAVAALDDRPLAAFPNVPAFCELHEFARTGTGGAGQMFREYFTWYPERVDAVFEVLSYFDVMNMADQIRCRVLAAVGGLDQNAPPKHFFAAYNRMQCEKDVKIYPFHGHTVIDAHRQAKIEAVEAVISASF
jgi:cephalosporin-C deacetylase